MSAPETLHDISIVLTAHREGPMAGISLSSMLQAAALANEAGLSTELLVVLDDPDELTKIVFEDLAQDRVKEVSFKDQGKVRNFAAMQCTGRYIAFLDGDDLWSENWLVAAYAECELSPRRFICHPAINWFFNSNNNIFVHADQRDHAFDVDFLRFANYWDALCLAPREAYLKFPYSDRLVAEGIAYEDWHWNCETLAAGYIHVVAADTIHFKRRREGSQTLNASAQKCLMPMNRFLRYDWPGLRESTP